MSSLCTIQQREEREERDREKERFISLVIMFHQHLACADDVYCKCRDVSFVRRGSDLRSGVHALRTLLSSSGVACSSPALECFCL